MQTRIHDQTVFGFKVTAITDRRLLKRIELAILRQQCISIASLNLHGIYVFHTDPVFRNLHHDEKTLVRIDGMSIIMLAHLVGRRLRREHRIAWIDFLPQILEQAASAGWRIFYIGGKPEILEMGLAKLRATHPMVRIDGCPGYFSMTPGSTENERIVARINAWRPDILLVGMGMGRQERWVAMNRDRLDVPVVAVCGACIEYFAGSVKTAPRWVGPLGLEWAFRLISDPRRFAWRYLVEPWLALGLLLRAHLRDARPLRRGPGDPR